jgi:hypothetical protein
MTQNFLEIFMKEESGVESPTVAEFSYKERSTRSENISNEVTTSIDAAKRNLNGLKRQQIELNFQRDIEEQIAKIDSLKLLKIPTASGEKSYYSLADSAGGVTEKTCLIDEDTLKEKLQKLARLIHQDEFEDCKISRNAILKFPKAGKDTEVQREAMGLKIANILDFKNVTDNTLVYHDTGNGQHPCLFVPFGNMTLLTVDIEKAQTSKGRLKQDSFKSVEDFGKYAAFFALCSDPDFIGKNGQNKGLTDAGEGTKRLYMFDQVFMTSKNLSLDRSFNLVPTNILAKTPNIIARHFMGRNKSVINDSSFEEKITGAVNVLQKKEGIKGMFTNIISAHSSDDDLSKTLRQDAKDCLKSFNERTRNIEKLFPSVKVENQPMKIADLVKPEQSENLDLVKKSMLVTQLLNKPQLFDKSGKPYRAPFFSNPSTTVKGVEIEGDQVKISFSRGFGSPLSETKKETLKQHGFEISEDGKSATISKYKLLELNEKSYFLEQKDSIEMDRTYFDSQTIAKLANNYHQDKANIDAISRITNLQELDRMPFKHQGFKAHVEQCFLHQQMKDILARASEEQKNTLMSEFKLAKSSGNLREFIETKSSELNKETQPTNTPNSLTSSLSQEPDNDDSGQPFLKRPMG